MSDTSLDKVANCSKIFLKVLAFCIECNCSSFSDSHAVVLIVVLNTEIKNKKELVTFSFVFFIPVVTKVDLMVQKYTNILLDPPPPIVEITLHSINVL
jgi:hypothetical protein